MEKISVGSVDINLNFEPQVSKKNRPFRLSGIELLQDKKLFIDGVLKHGTIYTFKYLDVYDEFFSFEFSPSDKFIRAIITESVNRFK